MITIHGSGLAGQAMAQLLSQKGIDSHVHGLQSAPPRQPVLLNADTVRLIEDIFDAPDISRLGMPVSRRVVARGKNDIVSVEAPALAIWMDKLLEALPIQKGGNAQSSNPAFEIDATGRQAIVASRWPDQKILKYGNRLMLVALVQGSQSKAIMELTKSNWVFSFPIDDNLIVIQTMVPVEPDDTRTVFKDIFRQTELVRKTVWLQTDFDLICFPAGPQILSRLATPTGLAIGAAAFAKDPICGDGIGATLHSTILAAATIEKIGDGNEDRLLEHYQARMVRSFEAHLGHLTDYYMPLTMNLDWTQELRTSYATVGYIKNMSENIAANMGYALENMTLVSTGGN